MAMPAGAAMPPSSDVGGRSFALLDRAERARLAAVLRPLPWIDGLITAVIVSPAEPDDWADQVYAESAPEELELSQEDEVTSVIDDHFMHVVDMLYDDPEAYRPYLNGSSDQMEAAAQWAAGFRFGIRLRPEPWGPIIYEDDARALLGAIFSLEKDEDIPEEERAKSPLRDISPEMREHLRQTTLDILPGLVLALHAFSLGLDDAGSGDLDPDPESIEGRQEPYVRAEPKVGRNDPCPCGSGKKYKRCCLAE